jgi:hypothetical protein
MSWYYLSFSDSTKPKGQMWAGACCVEAEDEKAAVRKAWMTGCNPGGCVLIHKVPPGKYVPEQLRHNLITDFAMLELLLGPCEVIQ